MISALVFRSELVVSPFGDGTFWYLRAPLRWFGLKGREIMVPSGFVTDFASVPRPIWWLFPRWAKYGNASVVHDWLYWTQPFDRQAADRAIFEGMRDMKVDPRSAKTIFLALRAFGWIAWKSNARARKAGRKRCIDQYPSDPLTTWAEYEREHGVDCSAGNLDKSAERLGELLKGIPHMTLSTLTAEPEAATSQDAEANNLRPE
jgi:hypothetical protein